MGPIESALIGFSVVATGMVSFAWGVLCRLRWERGQDTSSSVSPSFSYPPTAPGGWWIALGISLGFVGMILLAPFVASL